MSNSKSKPAEDPRVTIRVPASILALINRAAQLEGKSRNDFILESARLRASEVLIDQRVFRLNPRESEAFAEALANPPHPNEALRKLMGSGSAWA